VNSADKPITTPAYDVIEEGEAFKLNVNPEYEKIWNPMRDEVYNELYKDIEKNGQRDRVIVNEKLEILAGHNRYYINHSLGRKTKYVMIRVHGDDLAEKEFVRDENRRRRHVETDDERIKLAELWLPIYEERARRNQLAGKKTFCSNEQEVHSRRDVAKAVGLSETQLHRGMKVRRQDPELYAQTIGAGKETIFGAFNEYSKKQKQIKNEEKLQNLRLQASKIKLPEDIEKRLICGDFRQQEIPANSIDIIFTDPPYGGEYLYLYKDLGEFGIENLPEGGSLFAITGDYKYRQKLNLLAEFGLEMHGWFCIKHTGHSKIFHNNIRADCKPMVWFVKGDKPNMAAKVISNYIESSPPDKSLFNWAQSTTEAEHIISRITVENQIVCDPMMGVGTFGIAALNLGRQFIGIEIEPNRHQVAVDNITVNWQRPTTEEVARAAK
jgi:16S rRNA G966 N2-methylase RsmD